MRDTHILEALKCESRAKNYEHTIFIDESIDDVSYYRNVLSTLGSATPDDTVRMIINTGGGLLGTASSITHAMDTCQAHIIAVLTSNCQSAGTIIALHANTWEIGAGLSWMCHTASFGCGGSAEKVKKHHTHEQKMIEDLLTREYTGFYSEEEILAIADGDESWLRAEEVSERLENFALLRKQREDTFYQEQDDAMYEENNIMVAETLASLDVSESDKETFNRIHKMIDDSLAEQDTPSNEVATPKEEVLSLELTEVPFLAEDGTKLGDISYYQDGDNLGDIELEIELSCNDYVVPTIVLVDSSFLDADYRTELLEIMNKVTGRKYSKLGTETLINNFIKEVHRQIKENS